MDKLGINLLVILLSFPTSVAAEESDWPGFPPDCWEKTRLFHGRFEPDLWRTKMKINTLKEPEPKPNPGTLSPNGGYFFILDEEWPRARVTIYAEKDHMIDIKFSGLYGLSDIRWLNEKLLFMRPWWGRIQGTDIIYDVEREQIVYAENITDGNIAYRQFRESCPLLGCECIKKNTGE